MIDKELVRHRMNKQAMSLDYCDFCKKNHLKHPVDACPRLERMIQASKIHEQTREEFAGIRDERVREVLGKNPFHKDDYNAYVRVAQEVLVVADCDNYEGPLTKEEVEFLAGRKIILIVGEESHKDEVFERMKIEQNKGNNVFVQFVIPYENESTIENNRNLILEYIYKFTICDEYIFVGFKKDDEDEKGSDPSLMLYILNAIRDYTIKG